MSRRIKCPRCGGTGLELFMGIPGRVLDEPCEDGCEDGWIEQEDE